MQLMLYRKNNYELFYKNIIHSWYEKHKLKELKKNKLINGKGNDGK